LEETYRYTFEQSAEIFQAEAGDIFTSNACFKGIIIYKLYFSQMKSQEITVFFSLRN
jgi:hypothetical protein